MMRFIMEKKVTLTAVIHLEENLYVADCPEVGTVSQGTTIEEAIENLKEATELYLEEFPKETSEGVTGCVVPLHRELAIGTLRGILRQAQVT
jgi:predicted RNase H-like HicB family nuclease